MPDITLLATADWDHPLWTNKQHVAVSLARLGHRVLYIESLGLRGVRGEASDQRRIRRRLRRGFSPPREVAPNLWVYAPLVLPGVRGMFLTAINRLLLRIGLSWARACVGLRSEWLWTYNPRTLAYLDLGSYGKTIYHCVDHIQSQPGMNARDLDHWEGQLCRHASIVFVTSPALADRLHPLNPRTHFFPNVADYDHFASALDPTLAPPVELTVIPRPRVGFIGAISAYKLDLDLLGTMASRHPHWSFVLIGPVGEGDPDTDVLSLRRLQNVHFLGAKSYAELPAWLAGMDVAILPLRRNAYTDAMFPMKFFEYLAAGRAVVATPIRSLLPYGEHVSLVEPEAAAFAAAIEQEMQLDDPERSSRRQAFAASQTYDRRTRAMLALVDGTPTARV